MTDSGFSKSTPHLFLLSCNGWLSLLTDMHNRTPNSHVHLLESPYLVLAWSPIVSSLATIWTSLKRWFLCIYGSRNSLFIDAVICFLLGGLLDACRYTTFGGIACSIITFDEIKQCTLERCCFCKSVVSTQKSILPAITTPASRWGRSVTWNVAA